MGKKESATIIGYWYGGEDHGILTCWITLKYDLGGQQGFGGLILGSKTIGDDFVRQVCRLFYVTDLSQLAGKKCKALFSFGNWNESIEGLENEEGERFTLYNFREKHWPNDTKNHFDSEKDRLQREIDRAQERMSEVKGKLKGLKAGYTDWSK